MSEVKEVEIPEVLEDEGMREDVLSYLDELRRSGETNMFGAGPYLVAAFDMSRADSHAALGYWMKTFGERRKAGLTGDQ